MSMAMSMATSMATCSALIVWIVVAGAIFENDW